MASSLLQADNTTTTTIEIGDKSIEVPHSFICALTFQVMTHPVMTKSGLTFERSAIFSWLRHGKTTCPLTDEPMTPIDLVANKILEHRIESWRRQHRIELDDLHEAMRSKKLVGYLPVTGEQMDKVIGHHLVQHLSSSRQDSVISALRLTSSSTKARTERKTTKPAKRAQVRLNFLRRILAEADSM